MTSAPFFRYTSIWHSCNSSNWRWASRIEWTCLPKCNRIGRGGPVSTGASGEGGGSGRAAWHLRCFKCWTRADAWVRHRLPGVKRFLCTHTHRIYTHAGKWKDFFPLQRSVSTWGFMSRGFCVRKDKMIQVIVENEMSSVWADCFLIRSLVTPSR